MEGKTSLGCFICLLFNAIVLAKPLAGQQWDCLGTALFNTFPRHVASGVSGRFMTFVEETNSEAEKSRKDNEVRKISRK